MVVAVVDLYNMSTGQLAYGSGRKRLVACVGDNWYMAILVRLVQHVHKGDNCDGQYLREIWTTCIEDNWYMHGRSRGRLVQHVNRKTSTWQQLREACITSVEDNWYMAVAEGTYTACVEDNWPMVVAE